MKLLVLYKSKSEHGRIVEEFIHDLQSRTSNPNIEVLDIETREGAFKAEVYDIMSYPAILVTQDNGTIQNMWVGETLPLVNEVVAYLRA
jgi:hypothetical protein